MKKLGFLFVIMCLSSCASVQWGNFVQIPQAQNIYLAADATTQLMHVYPPARNTFCICQNIKDVFGIQLIQEMRQRGYGVIENHCPPLKTKLSYVVDEIEFQNLYRVSLFIGSQTLSRMYAKADHKLRPISAWSYKE